jgi:alpha-ketoglutarate-dependent taurine dioxygenase
LEVQYADFAVWQRRQALQRRLEEHLAYWRRQLAGAPPLLELPADRPRPAVQSFRGAQTVQRLPRELVERLRELGREAGATPFMTLLAGFEALLARLTGQTDLVIGSPIANRNRAELEPLIGFFVNALVLRTDLSGDPSFRALLGRVRETVLGAYAHQDLPFEKLVEDLKVERSLGHTPLFQVWFVFQNTPMPTGSFGGLTVSNEEVDDGTTKFDFLLFAVSGADGDLEVTWRYGTDLFEAATVARLQGQLEALLNHAAAQPDLRLSELELRSEAERERRSMEKTQRQEFEVKKLRFARRQAVDLPEADLVTLEPLVPGQPLPLLASPAGGEVDLTDWAGGNRDLVEERLSTHGAILFRGFGIGSVAAFERFASMLCGDLYGEYGDLPREEEGRKIYHSTPYPPDKTILFHNESSHMPRWPTRQFFYCVLPSQSGGETPIVDGRVMLRTLPPELVRRFEEKGVVYLRNFTEGLDVPWQEFFKTDDRAAVEERCRAEGMELTWKGNGLQTRQLCPAVTRHPRTGEAIWFNQLQLHHPACLEPEVRRSMLALFGEENLPRNVRFGDGTPIPDAVMDEISAHYWRNSVSFPWRQGNILMLDNMLVAHARNPYVGPRKIVVGMGSMLGVDQLPGGSGA